MFVLIKKLLVIFLASVVIARNHTKCMSLSNQKYLAQPTLINLHPIMG